MPFDCEDFAATAKCNHDNSIVIAQDKYCCIFNIYAHYLELCVERIIWIGFYKNNDNDQCLIKMLPKDLLMHILCLLGKNQSIVKPCIKITV